MRPLLVLAFLASAAALLGAAPSTQKVMDHDFIGADRCQACHQAEYAIWKKDPHARAFDVLAPKDRADPRCLSCHTSVVDDTSTGLQGVQCESCHGAGRQYAVEHVMRDADLRKLLGFAKVDAATCTRCHTDSTPALTPFVWNDKLPLIKHWR